MPGGVDPWGIQDDGQDLSTVPVPPGFSTPTSDSEIEYFPEIVVSGGGVIACPVAPMVPSHPGHLPPIFEPNPAFPDNALIDGIGKITHVGPWGPSKLVSRLPDGKGGFICTYTRTRKVRIEYVNPFYEDDPSWILALPGSVMAGPICSGLKTQTQTLKTNCGEAQDCPEGPDNEDQIINLGGITPPWVH